MAGKRCDEFQLDFSLSATDVQADGSITPLPPTPCATNGAFSKSLLLGSLAFQPVWSNRVIVSCRAPFFYDPLSWSSGPGPFGEGLVSFSTSRIVCEFAVQIRDNECFEILSVFRDYFFGRFNSGGPFTGETYHTVFDIEGDYSGSQQITEERKIDCITDVAGMSVAANMTSHAQVQPATAKVLVGVAPCGTGTLGFSGGVATVRVDAVNFLP